MSDATQPPAPEPTPPTNDPYAIPSSTDRPEEQPAGARPGKGLGTGALIGIVGGGIALLVVVISIVMVLVIGQSRAPATAGGAAGTGAQSGLGPAAVTEAFLQAVAASDAETALSYVETPPTDEALLTDEALAASNALAPIADITVTEPADASFSTEVTASYTIGGKPVTVDFRVSEYDSKGTWRVGNGIAEVDLSRFDGLDIEMNGETVGAKAEVFPGTYELSTSTPNFTLSGATTLTVSNGYDFPSLSDLDVTLSDEGLALFRSTVKDAANACLASKSLVAGCGLDIPESLSDGSRPVDGSLTRSLSAEGQAKLDSLEPQAAYGAPLQVRGDYIGVVSVTAEFDVDGSRVTGDLVFGPSLGSPFVDFTSGSPVLTWD